MALKFAQEIAAHYNKRDPAYYAPCEILSIEDIAKYYGGAALAGVHIDGNGKCMTCCDAVSVRGEPKFKNPRELMADAT